MGDPKPAAVPDPLPCPFCGEPPEKRLLEHAGFFAVWCSNKECPLDAEVGGATLDEAVARWNTRKGEQ